MLVIDKTGIKISKIGIKFSSTKSLSERIEWKNIEGFSEIKIQLIKSIIINVNNSDYWIEKEENLIRKKIMKSNLNDYGSHFSLYSGSTQMNHTELMKTLNENLNKYKYNA